MGLDIGTSGVRAAELSLGKHGATLERFGQVALPPGAVRDGEVVDTDAVCACTSVLNGLFDSPLPGPATLFFTYQTLFDTAMWIVPVLEPA